jgi:signal transduction histidine kinase
MLDVNLGIDELLFTDTDPHATFPGRPSPQTSLDFVLSGFSLMLLGIKRAWVLRVSQFLAMAVGFMAVVAIIGYVYHAMPFYGVTEYTGMAIHTATCFLLISIGIIFYSSDCGLAAIFTSRSEGGHMARRLLPAIIAIPIILGILSKTGERYGLFTSEFGMAMDVTLHIVLLGAELWLFSLFLDRSNIARDSAINSMKQHASQLKAANLELTSLSHAIPNNLEPSLKKISGHIDNLLKTKNKHFDEKEETELKSILECTKTMGSLVDDLSKLSQVSNAELDYQSVDLSSMANTILAKLSKKHPEHDIVYTVTPGLLAKGDSSFLQIALENLLENAWKFSCNISTSRIEVSAIDDNGSRTFFVRDNGVGFDMSKSDEPFRPFCRLHQTTEYPGTGIGLTIVQHIIHRHGGRVWIDSKKNQGTTVYFTLGR